MMQRIDIEKEPGVLTVKLSLWGRIVAGAYRGIKIFPWLMLIAAVFFLPDYIGRYAEQEPVPGLFWVSVLGLVLLGCFLWGVIRVVRRDRWVFDGNERQVAAEIPRLWRDPARGEADLRDIQALELRTRSWPWESELAVRIDTEDEGVRREPIFADPGFAAELEETAEEIVGFLKQQRYYVDLERPDHDEK